MTGQGTVVGLKCTRRCYSEQMARDPLIGNPGTYVLVTLLPRSLPRIRVGTTDELRRRLRNHNSTRPDWDLVVAFTSKDSSLNATHAKFLESRLQALADGDKCCLEREHDSRLPHMSDSDRNKSETFLREVLILAHVLSVDYFTESEDVVSSNRRVRGLNAIRESPHQTERSSRILTRSDGQAGSLPDGEYEHQGAASRGRGQKRGNSFTVFAGSQAVTQTGSSVTPAQEAKREELIRLRVLQRRAGRLVFARDHVFTSANQAAKVISGTSVNARTYWRRVSV